jgi:Uma2 family endonuclease
MQWPAPKRGTSCSNVLTAFVPAGKKKGGRTTSSDTAVQAGPDTIRYPDVVVDCGPPNAAAMTASNPTLIVEVSSPGTAVFDYGDKLGEYQNLKSVDTIIQIESEIAFVKVHRRQEDESGQRKSSRNLSSPFHLRRWVLLSR